MKEVSKVCQCVRDVSMGFQEVSKKFQGSFKSVGGKFQGYFKMVSRVFQGRLKGV